VNRRTLIATVPLALVPRLPSRSRSHTDDPPSLTDLLVDGDTTPEGWVPGTPSSPTVGQQHDGPPPTVHGGRSRRDPRTDEYVSLWYAERRFRTDSETLAEGEHVDVSLEVADPDKHTDDGSLPEAVRTVHELVFAAETENWELAATGWVDVDADLADDLLRQRSVASIRKPLCGIPEALELSTDKPMIEMSVAIVPLQWGVVVATGTIADPDENGDTRRLVTDIADRAAAVARSSPRPEEARR